MESKKKRKRKWKRTNDGYDLSRGREIVTEKKKINMDNDMDNLSKL